MNLKLYELNYNVEKFVYFIHLNSLLFKSEGYIVEEMTWVCVCDLSSSQKPVEMGRFKQDSLANATTSDCIHLPSLRSRYVGLAI